ncbi:MAG TPA: hypothetical protein VGL42_13345 [Opitutaceae bacterium]|jgi:hypothetical protein
MKFPTRSLVGLAAVLATIAVSSVSAQNVADGTYYFTASAGQPTNLNGSWVQFSSDDIVNWNLVDSNAAASFSWLSNFPGYGYPADFPPLTPGNSSVIESLTFASGNGSGPDAFNFEIGSPSGVPSTDAAVFFFSGDNNLNGGNGTYSALYDGATFNQVPVSLPDPLGQWSAASAPDASATSALFLAGLAALGLGAKFSRKSESAA